jgi:OOP family OmpA-OmpF porin
MHRTFKLVAAASIVMAAFTAQAADFYVGGSIGGSRWKVDEQPGLTIDKSDTGGKIFAGVALNEMFSVEVGYATLGKAGVTDAFVSGDVEGTGVFIDGVGQFAVGNNFSLLGRIGAFNGKAKVSAAGLGADDSGTDVKWGLGAAYAFNRAASIRVEWERYRFNVFGDKGDVDLLSLGLVYRF